MSRVLLFAYATSSETWEGIGLVKMLQNKRKELSFLWLCVDAHWMCFLIIYFFFIPSSNRVVFFHQSHMDVLYLYLKNFTINEAQ
jgi:hypothetical protein